MQVRAALGAFAGMAGLLAAAAGAQTVKDGVDAWQRGDYPAAIAVWRPLAEKGDGDAAFDLAQAYKLGRGVPADMARAKQLYGVAARAGHAAGIANYGLLLFQDGDRNAALPWIEKASAAGDPRAQYILGTALFNGDLLPRDWPRAYALMTRAGAAGLPQATTSLAQMDGYLSEADRRRAASLAATMAAQPMPPIGRQIAAAPSPPMRVAQPSTPTSTPTPTKVPTQDDATAPPRKPPSAPPAASGAWQVQLGAFASEAAARAAWKTLSAKAATLKALHPDFPKAGSAVRLRALGLADRAAAERACAAAKSAGAACFPVPPA